MNRIVREQWGKWCLLLSLVWTGWICVLFPTRNDDLAQIVEQADTFERIQVAWRPELGIAETLFPQGRAEDYRRKDVCAWTALPEVPPPPPVLVETPPVEASIRPAALLLPDPGPSLQGADRLPAKDKKALKLLPIEVRTGRGLK